MQVHQLKVGPMENFCYVIEDEKRKEAVLIDPGWDKAGIEAFLKEHQLIPVLIISTHSHFDHAQENLLWKHEGVKVLAHELSKDANADIQVKDKDTYRFGEQDFVFLHAPGHDPGAMLVRFGNDLFTGDTLFIGSIGRTDLPGSDRSAMQNTLQLLKMLPDGLIVWPGHDYGVVPSRTLGEEKRKNPYLR